MIKHRKPRSRPTSIVRYAATPAITAAHENDGLVAFEQAETDLSLSLGSDRRQEAFKAIQDRAICEITIEKRAAERATSRASRLEAFLGRFDSSAD